MKQYGWSKWAKRRRSARANAPLPQEEELNSQAVTRRRYKEKGCVLKKWKERSAPEKETPVLI